MKKEKISCNVLTQKLNVAFHTLFFQVPVNHPLHVDEVFDDISYNKGASLIRMLHGYIGNDVSLLQLLSSLQRSFHLS